MRVLIVLLWVLFLADSVRQDWTASETDAAQLLDQPWLTALVVAAPIVVFPLVGRFAKRTLFYSEPLARWIEARTRRDSLAAFLTLLRPVLLMGVGGLVIGAVAAVRSLSSEAPAGLVVLAMFSVSAGTGLVLAHVAFRRRGLPGG